MKKINEITLDTMDKVREKFWADVRDVKVKETVKKIRKYAKYCLHQTQANTKQ
jgi:hypothetical protein